MFFTHIHTYTTNITFNRELFFKKKEEEKRKEPLFSVRKNFSLSVYVQQQQQRSHDEGRKKEKKMTQTCLCP